MRRNKLGTRLEAMEQAAQSRWGHARIRVNNYVAEVDAKVDAQGFHVYTVRVGQAGPRESVTGPLGRAAAGVARQILARYESAAKKKRGS